MKNDQSSETEVATVMTMDEDESNVLLATSANGKSDWILDSGYAYHLCGDRCSLHMQHVMADLYGWRTTN